MKIKTVVVKNKLERLMEEKGFCLDDFCYSRNLKLLSLTKSDIEKIAKNYSEYIMKKGKVFEKAIDVFSNCREECFLKAYIMCFEKQNVYDFLEFDEDIYYNFDGYTTTKSSLEDFRNLLDKFSYVDHFNQKGVSFAEVSGMFFKCEYEW